MSDDAREEMGRTGWLPSGSSIPRASRQRRPLPPRETARGLRYGLTVEDYRALIFDLRRYFAWIEGGRKPSADPWLRTGVSRAQTYGARVSSGRPTGAPPPQAADPSDDDDDYAWLLQIDRAMHSMTRHRRRMFRLRYLLSMSNEGIARRIGCSTRVLADEWRLAHLDLYARLYPDRGVRDPT